MFWIHTCNRKTANNRTEQTAVVRFPTVWRNVIAFIFRIEELAFRRKLSPPSSRWTYLKMKAICLSEILVTIYKTTRRHKPDDHNRHLHRSEKIKSHRPILYVYWDISYISSANSGECQDITLTNPYVLTNHDNHHIRHNIIPAAEEASFNNLWLNY